MSDSYGEKIHPATARRRQQARAAGQVARSHDLVAALLWLGALGALFWWGGDLVQYLGQLTRQQLGGHVCLAADADLVVQWWHTTVYGAGQVLLPVLGLLVAIAVVAHLVQGGWLFLPHKLAADAQRVDPWRGLGRMFSANNLTRWLFGLLKALAVVAVGGWTLWAERHSLLQLGALDVRPLVAVVCELLFWTGLKIALVLLAIGLLDYGYQRWRLERDLRMTTQELREELKVLQGASVMNQRRSQLRREWTQNASPPAPRRCA
jgi:flagellar biosynthetic protein FlhB